ncbi:MAG TPA: LysR substrate-binding domain-containing protein [Polyangiaceae bacterium]|nr:LysR substrate-binding domain-containing protein [Polyangiaceae bacterium]
MNDPLETAELLAFSKTVEARSLSRAAAELSIPRATLSRRLARLEERIGARLLRRSTRSLALTDAGEKLYRHARIVLDAVQTAEASVRQVDDAVRGELRVAVPPIATDSFYALLCSFVERYPEVRLSVHVSSRIVDLVRDGYDVALRASTEMEPGIIARTLSREPVLCLAAPAYLTAHGMPRSARDLRSHRCLMGFSRGELPQTHWVFGARGRQHVEGILYSNELNLLRAAALRGLGIAYLPLMLVHEDLRSGALVPVLPDKLRSEALIAVVYPERQFVSPAVRAFVEMVVAWAPEALGKRLPEQCREAFAALAKRDARSGRSRRPRGKRAAAAHK